MKRGRKRGSKFDLIPARFLHDCVDVRLGPILTFSLTIKHAADPYQGLERFFRQYFMRIRKQLSEIVNNVAEHRLLRFERNCSGMLPEQFDDMFRSHCVSKGYRGV